MTPKQRISYFPFEKMDAEMQKEMDRCRREGTPRPESSAVREGASPRQNGMFGGAPWASSTRTLPISTPLIRQEVLPNKIMSPARLSTAKSSSTDPTTVPSGSDTTA